MEGLKFKIGPKSFYQTNSDQAYELYKITRDMAMLTGDEVVYDLYTGTGTIANFVAKQAKQVIGIEYVPEAIEDAKRESRRFAKRQMTWFRNQPPKGEFLKDQYDQDQYLKSLLGLEF